MDNPARVTVVLKSGVRIPVDAIFRGYVPDDPNRRDAGLPRFELVAEGVDWRKFSVDRVELGFWPANTTIGFDLPGMNPEEAEDHMGEVRWIENGNELWNLDKATWEDSDR